MSGHAYRRQSKKERDAAMAEHVNSRKRKAIKARAKALESGQREKPRA